MTDARAHLASLGSAFASVGDISPPLAIFARSEEVRSALVAPRFQDRLRARFLRRAGVLDDPASLDDDRVQFLLSGGEDTLVSLVMQSGLALHQSALVRMIDVSFQTRVARSIGMDTETLRQRIAGSAHLEPILKQIVPLSHDDSEEGIVDAIMRDGAACLRCWVAMFEPAPRRVLSAAALGIPSISAAQIMRLPKPEVSARERLFGVMLAERVATGSAAVPAED